MAKPSVEKIANDARAAVERWSPDQSPLSVGMCKVASSYLFVALAEAGYDPQLVQGVVSCDRRDPAAPPFLGEMLTPTHYWVLAAGFAVDVTADQFNDRLIETAFDPVVIASPDELSRHIAHELVEPFEPSDGDWARAFREAPKDW